MACSGNSRDVWLLVLCKLGWECRAGALQLLLEFRAERSRESSSTSSAFILQAAAQRCPLPVYGSGGELAGLVAATPTRLFPPIE